MAWADSRIGRHLRRVPSDLLWLSAAISLAALPHLLRVPFWIGMLFCLLVFWRLYRPQAALGGYTLLSVLGKSLMAMLMLGGIFITYGTLMGRDAGVALLLVLSGMKLVEVQNERDHYITVFIGLLLILTNFLYSQTMPTAVYTTLTILMVIATLIGFNDQRLQFSVRGRLRHAGRLLLQALPLILLLFLFFPRAPGPLWGLPEDALAGISGIDDEMTPGSVSQLSLSDEVAFRVSFEGDIPGMGDRYWRGPVLWHTDGFKWERDRRRPHTEGFTMLGEPVSYTITLETTSERWLFALEMPDAIPEEAHLTTDGQVRRRDEVQQRTRYDMTSYLDYRNTRISEEDLRMGLALPRNRHPQTVELGESWRRELDSDAAIVERGITYFREGDFAYTLTPAPLRNDPVDEFLFQTQNGFCEHYAAAFTVLMRAAGVPARVVLGYQGGRVNPVGEYLIVRQRDAHAWVEVWLGEERGWVRQDPTAAVSPARVSTGIEQALPGSIIDIPLGLQNNFTARRLWEQASNTWDAINNGWNQWVLGYDHRRQSRFLDNLGLEDLDYGSLLLGLVFAIMIFFLAMAVHLFWNANPDERDAAQYWYRRFQERLSRRGIRADPFEGPVDYAARAGRQCRDLAPAIERITGTYVAIRYGRSAESVARLRQLVKNFRPGKPAANYQ